MSTETAKNIWANFWKSDKWVAENGLARLDPKPESDLDCGFIDGLGLESVRNENGILFLAVFLCASKAAGLEEEFQSKRTHFGATLERLRRKGYTGLINRRPFGDKPVDRHEAHDNYAGAVVLSALYNIGFEKEVVTYGARTGGNFNNVDPLVWKLEQQFQGGELGFHQAVAGYVPSLYYWIWFLIGTLIQVFRPSKDHSSAQLSWIRIWGLNELGVNGTFAKASLFVVTELWLWRMGAKFKNLYGIVDSYYKPGHPILAMAKEVEDFGF